MHAYISNQENYSHLYNIRTLLPLKAVGCARGLYLLCGQTSYHKISWILKPRDSNLDFSNRFQIRQAPQQQYC